MGHMAGCTPFKFDRRVFERKGASHGGMAFGADLGLPSGGTQHVGIRAAMLVVTICALDQMLIHRMPEGTVELRADILVAMDAELRLLAR